MKKKKILFTHLGSFSHINDAVLLEFQSAFQEFEIETIDLKLLLKRMSLKDKLLLIVNSLFVTKRWTPKNIKNALTKSPYFWKLTKSLIKKAAKSKEYIFTFQTQSNFDGKISNSPHFVYTDHTHLVNLEYPGFSKHKLNPLSWQQEEANFYKRTDGLFTMSNHVKNSLLNQYHIDASKVKCVFAGANISQENISYPLSRYQAKKILFVGVDWVRKGGPELVEAFKLVLQKHPNAQLDIVGCDPGIDVANVQIWGKLPIHEVKKFYENASVFCMPSKREPFGIVYLEAMAHKLPIVALKIGALPDFVDDGKSGYLVDFMDIQGLADKLCILLENPDLCQQMGELAFEKVRQQYSWNSSIQGIKEYIKLQGVI
ncbi:glycosyltransferase family 4 protein [Cognataquiflexum rubidum]|uniref:glycosyltransferase family 4 protein n=1 Tax=Cognataquiflexum rubidum TaxID=2922273 RepID=UPI001F12F26B|nr:glycosyltransferase family 4 protein [Cognataquiflexum rubidum]MCH6236780.1 glycosyltransferase family 4 protein [Cognataquiflexum rubidum]